MNFSQAGVFRGGFLVKVLEISSWWKTYGHDFKNWPNRLLIRMIEEFEYCEILERKKSKVTLDKICLHRNLLNEDTLKILSWKSESLKHYYSSHSNK